jgi:hypothetical protein
MACPTCDGILTRMCAQEDMRFFHCEVCGTLFVAIEGHDPLVYVPKLVERCREFEQTPFMVNIAGKLWAAWRRLGIAESINTPDNRC